MKFTDIKDEAAIEALADIIEPAGAIFTDQEVILAYQSGNKLKSISLAIKNHKKEVMTILAALDGVPVENYHVNIMTLPAKLLEILNDKEVMSLFTYAEPMMGEKPLGSAGTIDEQEISKNSAELSQSSSMKDEEMKPIKSM